MPKNLKQFLIEDAKLQLDAPYKSSSGRVFMEQFPGGVTDTLEKIRESIIITSKQIWGCYFPKQSKVSLEHLLHAETVDYQEGHSIILRTKLYVLAVENQPERTVARIHGIFEHGGRYLSLVSVRKIPSRHFELDKSIWYDYYTDYPNQIKNNRKDHFAISDELFKKLKIFDNI